MAPRVTSWSCAAALLLALAGCCHCRSGDGAGASADNDEAKSVVKQGLQLRLWAGKTSYGKEQPLQLRAHLVNSGGATLTVLRRAAHVDLGLDARNDAGEFITSLLPPAPPRPPTAADLYKLAPGASVELVNWELLQRVNQQIAAGNGRSGAFRVSASYHVGVGTTSGLRKLDPAAWVGALKSGELRIEVK